MWICVSGLLTLYDVMLASDWCGISISMGGVRRYDEASIVPAHGETMEMNGHEGCCGNLWKDVEEAVRVIHSSSYPSTLEALTHESTDPHPLAWYE